MTVWVFTNSLEWYLPHSSVSFVANVRAWFLLAHKVWCHAVIPCIAKWNKLFWDHRQHYMMSSESTFTTWICQKLSRLNHQCKRLPTTFQNTCFLIRKKKKLMVRTKLKIMWHAGESKRLQCLKYTHHTPAIFLDITIGVGCSTVVLLCSWLQAVYKGNLTNCYCFQIDYQLKMDNENPERHFSK